MSEIFERIDSEFQDVMAKSLAEIAQNILKNGGRLEGSDPHICIARDKVIIRLAPQSGISPEMLESRREIDKLLQGTFDEATVCFIQAVVVGILAESQARRA